MGNIANATVERIDGPVSRADATVTHIDADGCAGRYGISKRHWLRMTDAGKAPRPIRLGRLVRWSLAILAAWEQDGCKPVRQVGRAV